jgi:hypothetical protein
LVGKTPMLYCGVIPTILAVVLAAIATPKCLGEQNLASLLEVDMTPLPTCYTLLNDLGTVGCRSMDLKNPPSPVLPLNSQQGIDDFVANGINRHVILLPHALLTSRNLNALGQSGLCAGVLVASPEGNVKSFSPSSNESYCMCSAGASCSGQWNPAGNSLVEADLNFGMVALDSNSTSWLRARISGGQSTGQSETGTINGSGYPRLVAQLQYAMDVFQDYRWSAAGRGGGGWWRIQQTTKCCRNCKPNCGSACCNTAGNYECTSRASHSDVSWEAATCAQRGGPTSISCLESGTCQPIGGFNVWSILASNLPLPKEKGIVLVAVRMDAAGIFHAAQNAAARASSMVALIAAAHALTSIRDALMQAPNALLLVGLQGESWGNIGSSKLMWDLDNFNCTKLQPNGAFNMCLDPLMLAPDISKVSRKSINFALEVDQPISGKLYWHSGCSPSPASSAVKDMIMAMPW